MMSEPKRQHFAAAVAHAADYIRQHYITLILFVVIGVGKESLFSLIFILGPFIFILISGIVKWYWFTYQIVDQELRVEQGIINKKNIYIPFNRIQAIDISRAPVQRLFGLVSLEVKTAGESSKEAKIHAIRLKEAEQIKATLRKGASDKIIEETEREKEAFIYKLPNKNLFIAALTNNRLLLIVSLLAIIEQVFGEVYDYDQLFNLIQNYWHLYATSFVIILLIIGLLIAAWLISFGYTIIINYNFSITVREDELLISRGLIKNIRLTIPLDRIQAITVKEGILRQPFGYASLLLEDAGYATTTLFPLIAKEKIPVFLSEVLPEYHVENKSVQTPVPLSGLRRYLLRKVWKLLPVIILCWIFIPYGIFAWLLLIPGFLLSWLQYKDAGIRVSDDTILLRSRILSKQTGIIKKYRMQAVKVHQNPFQARLNLGDFSLYVISGKNKRRFRVRELPRQFSFKYWQWFSHEKEKDSATKEDTMIQNSINKRNDSI
jgi:putative membrane protein